MGAPNITGTATGAVTEGTGAVIGGNLDDLNPWFPSDTWSVTVAATYGTATINPATGVWSYDLDDSNPAVQALDSGDTLTDTFTVRLSDAGGSDTQVVSVTISGAPCFTPGTHIATLAGPRAVEDIAVGDLITTRDHGAQAVRWVGRRTVPASGAFAPIRIPAGALGNARDLVVSPQHRMLISGWRAELFFGQPEVLVAARHLVGRDGIAELPGGKVTYIHLLFDRHEIIFAEGAPTESFFIDGDYARKIAGQERELLALFGELAHGAAGRTALPCLTGAEARLLRA